MNYSYSSNIREFKNLLDRMVLLSYKGFLRRDAEAKFLTWVLNQFNGNVSDTAKALDVTPRYVQYKIKEYEI